MCVFAVYLDWFAFFSLTFWIIWYMTFQQLVSTYINVAAFIDVIIQCPLECSIAIDQSNIIRVHIILAWSLIAFSYSFCFFSFIIIYSMTSIVKIYCWRRWKCKWCSLNRIQSTPSPIHRLWAIIFWWNKIEAKMLWYNFEWHNSFEVTLCEYICALGSQ